MSDEEAAVLLRYFKWNAVRVHEEWFQARPSAAPGAPLLACRLSPFVGAKGER